MLELKHRYYKNHVYPYRDNIVDGRVLNNLRTCAKFKRVTIKVISSCCRPCKLELSTWRAWTSTPGSKNNVIFFIGVATWKDSESYEHESILKLFKECLWAQFGANCELPTLVNTWCVGDASREEVGHKLLTFWRQEGYQSHDHNGQKSQCNEVGRALNSDRVSEFEAESKCRKG